jgi:hypothetical protein
MDIHSLSLLLYMTQMSSHKRQNLYFLETLQYKPFRTEKDCQFDAINTFTHCLAKIHTNVIFHCTSRDITITVCKHFFSTCYTPHSSRSSCSNRNRIVRLKLNILVCTTFHRLITCCVSGIILGSYFL